MNKVDLEMGPSFISATLIRFYLKRSVKTIPGKVDSLKTDLSSFEFDSLN